MLSPDVTLTPVRTPSPNANGGGGGDGVVTPVSAKRSLSGRGVSSDHDEPHDGGEAKAAEAPPPPPPRAWAHQNAAVRYELQVSGTEPQLVPEDVGLFILDIKAVREGLAVLLTAYACSASKDRDRSFELGLKQCEAAMLDAMEDQYPPFSTVKRSQRTPVQNCVRVLMTFAMRLASRNEPMLSDPSLSVVGRVFMHATSVLRTLCHCAVTHDGCAAFCGTDLRRADWDPWLESAAEQRMANAAVAKLQADVEVLSAQVQFLHERKHAAPKNTSITVECEAKE